MVTERNAEFFEIIKNRLNPKRLYNSICVAEKAKHLAEKYGSDVEKAYTAGLVHDIMKNQSAEEMLQLIEDDGQVLSDSEKAITVTLHSIAGEIFLRKNLNVTDEELLSAVRWHTTGKEDMSLFEKIIYVADLVSDDRDYPDVEEVRQLAEEDLDKTLLRGLSFTIEDNAKKHKLIHTDTVKAYNYYAERIR
jgi:predicted HD superfamily hydrolase involved in NAD metabolism